MNMKGIVSFGNSIEHNFMDRIRMGSIFPITFGCLGNRTHTKFGVRIRLHEELNRDRFISQTFARLCVSSSINNTFNIVISLTCNFLL